MEFFVINLTLRGQSPSACFIKFGALKEFPVRTLTPNLAVVAFKMWAYRPKKSPKLVIFLA